MAIYRQALCPVCGTAHGSQVTETIPGKPYMVLARRNYWEKTLEFDPNKAFGVIQETGLGRGRSFRVLGYFSPEEDEDGYFPLVKARLLQAVREWLDKGWISPQEATVHVGPAPRIAPAAKTPAPSKPPARKAPPKKEPTTMAAEKPRPQAESEKERKTYKCTKCYWKADLRIPRTQCPICGAPIEEVK